MMFIAFIIILIFRSYTCHQCEYQTIQVWNWVSEFLSNDWSKIFICENVYLKEDFSLEHGKDAEYLVFKNSTINSVPEDLFASFSKLTFLFMNSTGIANVVSDSFNGLIKLEALFLRDNYIKTIPNGTFHSLTSLRLLDISFNRIENMEDIFLTGLSKLEELVLSYNTISEINKQTFESVKSLRSLDLAHNKLATIDGTAFLDIPAIERLLINDNLLQVLPKEVFENFPLLRILDVSNNNQLYINITKLPTTLEQFYANGVAIDCAVDFTKTNISRIDIENNNISNIIETGRGIDTLDLGNNALQTLHQFSFKGGIDLINLDLSHNQIREVSGKVFRSLKKLKTLNLSNNKISYLPVGCFENQNVLYSLKLSSNNINSIDEFGTFFGLTNLTVLFLDNNGLQFIQEKTLYVLENLQELHITNNELITLNALELLNRVQHLSSISLHNNYWKCNSLLEIVNAFTNRNVSISSDNKYLVENVNGIACYSSGKLPFAKIREVSQKDVPEISRHRPKSYKNIESDFTNLKFYKLFNSSFFDNINLLNSLQQGFRETSFYKYLENDFLNSSFVRYFSDGYKKNDFFKQLDTNSNNRKEEVTTRSSTADAPTRSSFTTNVDIKSSTNSVSSKTTLSYSELPNTMKTKTMWSLWNF